MSEAFEDSSEVEAWIEVFVDDIIHKAINEVLLSSQISGLKESIDNDLLEIKMPTFPVSSSRIIMQKQQKAILININKADKEKDDHIKLKMLQSIIDNDIALLKECRDIAENGVKMKNEIFEYQNEFQKRIQRLSLMDNAKKRLSDEAKSVVDRLEAALDEDNSDGQMDMKELDNYLSDKLEHAKKEISYLGEVGQNLAKISQMKRSITNTLEKTPGKFLSWAKNEIEKKSDLVIQNTNDEISCKKSDTFYNTAIERLGDISIIQKQANDLLLERTEIDDTVKNTLATIEECQRFILKSSVPNPKSTLFYQDTERHILNIKEIQNDLLKGANPSQYIGYFNRMSENISDIYKGTLKLMEELQSKEEFDKYLDNLIIADSGNPVDMAKNLRAIAAISTRFNLDISIERNAVTKCMPRFYAILCMIPPNHLNHDKLQKIEFYTEPAEAANYYIASDNRISFNAMPEQDSPTTYAPDSGNAIKISYYTSTTLHEVGHSVDAKIGYMSKNQSKKNFGVWKENIKIETIAKEFVKEHNLLAKYKETNEHDYIQLLSLLLEGKIPSKPQNIQDKMGSLLPHWRNLEKDPIWEACFNAGTAKNPWYGGVKRARSLMAGGRVYHEAYTNDWVSYEFDERAATGISEYQWRAPAEWFAEIYALHILKKLPGGHPMTQEFKNNPKLNGTEPL